jgi:outer membrane protein, heavy metal efflux system
MKHRAVLALPLLALLSGCHSYSVYRAAPLAPPAIARSLEARSLDDPALRAWMEHAAAFTPSSWPLPQWDLDSLTLAAYYFNPALDVARARAATASAAIQTAAMKPNPTASVGPGYESAPETPFMFGFDLSVPIETAGKRGYRVAEAQHLSEASRIDVAQAAWRVRGRVRAALINYLFAIESADALRGQEGQQSQYADLLEARFKGGEIPRPEVTTAQIDLTNLREALRAAEGQAASARAALAAAIGIPVTALAGKQIQWAAANAPPAPDVLDAPRLRASAIENRLDVQSALGRYEAAQSALQLEIARQYPDINLGPGYAFEEGAHLISLQMSAVLPLRNHNQGPIAEAEAARKMAGAQLLATQSSIVAATDQALAQYNAAYAVLQQARQSVAQSQQQSRVAEEWLKAGESDRLAALSAQLQFTIAERARIDALHQAQLALGTLEDALQHPLSPATAPPLPQVAPRLEKQP